MKVCPECGKLMSTRFPVHACYKVTYHCPDCGEARVEEVYVMPDKTDILCSECACKATLKRLG